VTNVPDRLYKYCGPGGLAILERAQIHLTQPRAFNDPFELKPHYATTVYLRTPTRVVAMHDVQVAPHDAVLRIQNTVVLSLSANPSSLLMWAHYTAAHTGLLIGFDPRLGILAGESPHRLFTRVEYAAQRPSKLTYDQLSDAEVLCTKSQEWAYEQEWRVVDSLYSADGEVDASGHCWPFNIRPEAVTDVTLGCRVDPDTEQRTMRALLRPEYEHVKLRQAVPDERQYGLQFEELPREEWRVPHPPGVAGFIPQS
jgi:hypothetical protein